MPLLLWSECLCILFLVVYFPRVAATAHEHETKKAPIVNMYNNLCLFVLLNFIVGASGCSLASCEKHIYIYIYTLSVCLHHVKH